MPSEKFRITTNGQSLRNPSNGFFGMTLSANLTLDESDASAHNDRRSAHNALERQRREHLNVKFQQLAHALPALQTVRRPSKTMIVAKSLEFVSSSLRRETKFMTEIEKLRAENERLKKQAKSSCQQLKQQVALDEKSDKKSVGSVKEEEPSTVDAKSTGLKRKASNISSAEESSQQQLSPPPTPEAIKKNHKSPVVVSAPIAHPKKKRMVKQTKPLQHQQAFMTSPVANNASQSQQQQQMSTMISNNNNSLNTTMPNLSWPSLCGQASSSPSNNINSANYFDMNTALPSSYTTVISSSNNTSGTSVLTTSTGASPIHDSNMLFLTPTSTPIDLYQEAMHSPSYDSSNTHSMIHPMLLAPYFVPSSNEPTSELLYHYQQRDQQHYNGYYM